MRFVRYFLAGLAIMLLSSSLVEAQSANQSPNIAPTVQNAAYASGNSLGGLQQIGLFAGVSGIEDLIWIASKGGSTVAMTFYLFDSNPTNSTCTDNAAFVLNAADVQKLAFVPFVLTPALIGVGSTVTFAQQQLTASMRNHDVKPGNTLYLCIVTAGVTPASTTDLVGKISGAID